MTRAPLLLLLAAAWVNPAAAGYWVAQVQPVALDGMPAEGHAAALQLSRDGQRLSFEFTGAGGDTLEVYVARAEWGTGAGLRAVESESAVPRSGPDPFRLGGTSDRAVSEGASWGADPRGRPRLAVAATRSVVAKGATQVSFDLYLVEAGRRRFLTDHPDNDAHPAFSPDGEVLAFSSGRTGQGDLYLYHFFAAADPHLRLTQEAAGSELYPAWHPSGDSLAYVGHLGTEAHLYVLGGVKGFLGASGKPPLRPRDLTPGWKGTCLAPSYSPDGRWVAFYARDAASQRADLYVVPTEGGPLRKLLEGGLPETRGGPRWAPGSDGLVAVLDDAPRFNPLTWVPLTPGQAPRELTVPTQLNADPVLVERGDALVAVYSAQGTQGASEKRWRRLYAAVLQREAAR